MLNRRDLLQSAAATGASAVGAFVLAQPVPAQPHVAPGSGAYVTPLNALFDTFMQERLAARPEFATSLGLDTGRLAPARHRLSDASLAGVAADKAMTASQLQRLKAFDAAALRRAMTRTPISTGCRPAAGCWTRRPGAPATTRAWA